MTQTAVRQDADPVTMEVLRNAFISTVDQMAEQILQTCHSFSIYARDFSCALADRHGNTVAQGNSDSAAHVGTLHFTARAIVETFGEDIKPGDVFVTNDPYIGATHFSDVRVIRPIFAGGRLLALAQSNGHWGDIGGSVPGSFDVTAREHFGEGLRIKPVRVWREGEYLEDVAGVILGNVRAPEDSAGDLHAQAEATRVAEREVLRLVEKYGLETVETAFDHVQDYVERYVRTIVAELPDGEWEGEDYLDYDPGAGEGLIPIHVRMKIEGDRIHYDLSRSHPAVASLYNSAFGGSHSALYAGTKFFFPDLPLNSGFYRPIEVDLGPQGSVVNAVWPTAVTGFIMPYEKIVNILIEMWSELFPDRMMACSYNTEYLQVGGRDERLEGAPFYMWHDWLSGGWGGRADRDGAGGTTGVFSAQMEAQSIEGQERLSPGRHLEWQLYRDSGGPGKHRGGLGVRKRAILSEGARDSVLSYFCDRARAIVWGIQGGLPSCPHGLWVRRASEPEPEFLGVYVSKVDVGPGDAFERCSVGGGGLGDPLLRDPEEVREDVTEGYVSVERAAKDYGVVIEEVDADLCEYAVDAEATERAREEIRANRRGWLEEDPEGVAKRYRDGELDPLDLIRRYGVIVDWGSGEALPETTKTFRAMVNRRAASQWE
jgi:N-methylhydantoinase B